MIAGKLTVLNDSITSPNFSSTSKIEGASKFIKAKDGGGHVESGQFKKFISCKSCLFSVIL